MSMQTHILSRVPDCKPERKPREKVCQQTHKELIEMRSLQQQYTKSWLWRTLASFVETRNFNPSPIWIARRLNVTVEEVIYALEGLEKLGIIKRTETGYKRTLKFVYFKAEDLDPDSVLSDHMLVSSQIMSRLNTTDRKTGSFYRTGFVGTSPELVAEFCENIEKLMRNFLEKSSESVQNEIFAFTFSNVNVAGEKL